jgi:hypothetical protein
MENQPASIVLSCSAVVLVAVLDEVLLVAYIIGRRVFLMLQFVDQEDVEDRVVSISAI